MTDLQTIKDRLFFFIEGQGISVRKFERMCGLSNGYVKGIRQSIQPDKLELIAEQFPMLSKAWLMTGEGEMLKGQTEAPEAEQTDAARIAQLRAEMDELKKQLDDERRNLLEQNKKLTDIIERLTKEG